MIKGLWFYFFFVLTTINSLATASDQSGNLLIQAFGSECQLLGPQTRRALDQANAIQKIIKTIRQDEECEEWSQSISQAISSTQYLNPPPGSYEWDKLTLEISQLEDALALETDLNSAYVIASALGQKKVDLYSIDRFSGNAFLERKSEFLGQVGTFINGLNSNMGQNTRCFAKYPGLVAQVGGHVLQLAGQFNMWAQAIGTGLVASGSLLDMLIQVIREKRTNDILEKLELNSLKEGLMCSIEAVTDVYCKSQELHERIKIAADTDLREFSEGWKGLFLIKNLPVFNSWMTSLVAGSPSKDPASAERKKAAIKLRARFDEIKEDITAGIAEGEQLLSKTPEDQREKVLGQIVRSLVKVITPFTGRFSNKDPKEHPFFNYFSKDIECGPPSYLMDPKNPPNISPILGNRSCTDYIKDFPIPSFAMINQRINLLLPEVQEYVNLRFALVKETDPLSVLVKAETPGERRYHSPINLLRKSYGYLEKVNQFGLISKSFNTEDVHTLYLISETMEIISSVIEIYERPICRGPRPDNSLETCLSPSQKIKKMKDLLAPLDSRLFLSDRMRKIVNWEIKKKLEGGNIPDPIEEILRLSISDHLNTLLEFLDLDFEQVRRDVVSAMTSSHKNLDTLGRVFRRKLKKIFKRMKKDLEKNPGNMVQEENLKNLCAMVLTFPDQDEANRYYKVKRYCKGKVLRSIYKKSNIKLNLDELISSPFPKRACGYYHFMKQNKLYRVINRRPF